MTSPKITVTWLYPKKDLERFDMEYYLNNHIPSTKKAWEPLGMENLTAVELQGNDDYTVQVTTIWTSFEAWTTAIKDPVSRELGEDLKNYTNVKPVMLFGKVLV